MNDRILLLCLPTPLLANSVAYTDQQLSLPAQCGHGSKRGSGFQTVQG
ncbi:hypothetical protein [Pectobacterium carotovorum]|nr:hypothetical protein [Pectobacterium carotovorum]SHG56123.1 hypothetical protein SAMN05444147_103121 [Pectobacterium carotovorum]